MKILDYVRRMAPTYERKEISHVLKQLHEELDDFTLPAAKGAQEAFVDHTFKSTYARELTQSLRKRVMFQGSPLDVLVNAVERLEQNIPALEAEIKRQFSFQFATSNLTYSRLTLLRYIEAALFFAKYFRKLLLRLVAEEAVTLGSAAPIRWSKAEKMWLDTNLKTFVDVFPYMDMDSQRLVKMLKNASTAEIDESTFDVAQKTLGSAMDPMQLGKMETVGFSPVFSVGKAIAELQVKRYQGVKEEHQALLLRLQELREMKEDGRISPKMQKLIEYTEDRIEKLDYQINQIEENNRLD